MSDINKIIQNLNKKKVISKKQLDKIAVEKDKADKLNIKRQEKIFKRNNFLKWKEFTKERTEINRLIKAINKKFYKKYEINVFEEIKNSWVTNDKYFDRPYILNYVIRAPYKEEIFKSPGLSLSYEAKVKKKLVNKKVFGIKYTSTEKEFRYGPDEAHYVIRYSSGGPSPRVSETDPDNRSIKRLTKKEIFDELIKVIEYHANRL
jgi:hypothetical protein